ncbi:MAG: hypothetical protein FJ143_11955 [Deltaproteobacteria bacterium]|nr:hypothetical protein [Deltaproteobacteria bacterium]
MAVPCEFTKFAVGDWQILARKQIWNAKLQGEVLARTEAQAPARHPQTIALSHIIDGVEQEVFLKVFHRRSLAAAVKDQLRRSRALGSWRQGMALAAAGFNAPSAIAVGVELGWRVARREFILTEKVTGLALTEYLREVAAAQAVPVALKREGIRRLARLIRRFHDAGFVHGDLIAANIFVERVDATGDEFYFMDNDRTRQYPVWLRPPFWKRNLIQLNRMPLPGISLQDRMRFLHEYLNLKRLSKTDRQFARWLEARTRQRRQECDGADPSGSFRRLMRWSPELADAKTG